MLWDTLNLKKDETNSFFGSQAFGRLRMVLSLFLSYQFNKDRTNHSLPKTFGTDDKIGMIKPYVKFKAFVLKQILIKKKNLAF